MVAMNKWLDEETWRGVQRLVPIACVDLLALGGTRDRPEIGLIFRDTPHQGQKWCLIGGRILQNETAHQAIQRHVADTLGHRVRCEITTAQPLFVAEYFTDQRSRLFDPRQHAVALNYAGRLTGEVVAAGEAQRFEWFSASLLPARDEFGFGQDLAVDGVATALGLTLSYGRPAALRRA
jgi:YD repeat-containing protein